MGNMWIAGTKCKDFVGVERWFSQAGLGPEAVGKRQQEAALKASGIKQIAAAIATETKR